MVVEELLHCSFFHGRRGLLFADPSFLGFRASHFQQPLQVELGTDELAGAADPGFFPDAGLAQGRHDLVDGECGHIDRLSAVSRPGDLA
jgi:hypothetical protein